MKNFLEHILLLFDFEKKYFDKDFQLDSPINSLQKSSVNKSIKYVKMGIQHIVYI